MPLVRIDLDDAIPAHRRRAIADAIHDALVTSLAMPPHDRFQIITTHPGHGELIFDAHYLGVDRRNVVFIQTSWNSDWTHLSETCRVPPHSRLLPSTAYR